MTLNSYEKYEFFIEKMLDTVLIILYNILQSKMIARRENEQRKHLQKGKRNFRT